jgi:hypothetical protein
VEYERYEDRKEAKNENNDEDYQTEEPNYEPDE